MIVLDTNIISELMLREPAPGVLAWLDEQPPESIWTTAITVFEIRYGLALLPESRRRTSLETRFTALLSEDLENRVLDFDPQAADASASLGALRKSAGKPIELRDLQIAGIVLARRATLVTRNVRHFEGTGVPLLNPWV